MIHLRSALFTCLFLIGPGLISVQVFSQEPVVFSVAAAGETITASAFTAPLSNVVIDTDLWPKVTAKAFIIFDVDSGRVLASRDANTPYPIASVTKLFTAAAIMDSFDMESKTTLTQSDILTEGLAGNLRSGEVFTYRELLFPLILTSSNDAAAALLRATDGSLLGAMEDIAKRSGAQHTRFLDSSGLSPENVASASDLMLFMSALGVTYPYIFDISRLSEHLGTYTGWRNNITSASMTGYVGGKHGYTPEAGRTLVSKFTESLEGGERTIGYVLLGSDNLRTDINAMRDFVAAAVTYQ